MGRPRTIDSDLPPGLQAHRRQFRARAPEGRWKYFGANKSEAKRAFAAWRNAQPREGTVGWLLDHFVSVVCPGKVKAERMAPRTASDYLNDTKILKDALGHIPIAALEPRHVGDFRDERAQAAPTHVRNEMACLSAAFSWGVEKGYRADNPCLQIARPTRAVRQRLISDAEFITVYRKAGLAIRRCMTLGVRTLALPADILALGPRNVVRLADGKRVLRFARGKTGVVVEIEIVGELASVIDECLKAKVVHETFVHRRDGKPFTGNGIRAMFGRYCRATKVADFGLRDLRAKGATDGYRAGRSIRELQHLLGHKSPRTTEIYLKALVPETVRPHEEAIVGVD
jgi:integrase